MLRNDLYDEDPLARWGWHEHIEVWPYGWLTDDLQPHPYPQELGGEG
jgi:hypothetical protein